jgi:UDP-N-acetylglucosamine 2-epimerase (non-hydrolysing)
MNRPDAPLELALDSLETPALTKAQLADLLFEQIGLNKRESKDMVDAFFDVISAELVAGGEVEVVYPVHLNPLVKDVVQQRLGHVAGVHLIAPQDYVGFVRLMQRAFFVLTDSGGVQEEAPALGKPVLLLRDVTERPLPISA